MLIALPHSDPYAFYDDMGDRYIICNESEYALVILSLLYARIRSNR